MKLLLDRLRGDRVMWLIVLLISFISLLAVYSSTGTLAYKYKAGNTEYYLIKHFLLLLFGLGMMFLAHLVNFKYYSRVAQLLLIISIPLLFYTTFFGSSLNEASRWITLPVINLTFQTSDLAKIALIMYTARALSREQHQIDSRNAFLKVIGPVILICGFMAPADLSSAAVLFFTCLLLMFIGRVHMRYIGGFVGLSIIGLCIFLLSLFALPESALVGRMPTWKSRIESFTSGSEGEPYQVQQAKIAIAQGGLIGKGPGNSTQRNFLPHPYSDFIFAIIVEEYGLLGGFVIVVLYLIFLYRCILIVVKSPNTFGALLAVGLGLSLVIQAFINLGVSVNLLPVTGLTLPLISMGGTSVWFTSIAIGIILSVSVNLDLDNENDKKAAVVAVK